MGLVYKCPNISDTQIVSIAQNFVALQQKVVGYFKAFTWKKKSIFYLEKKTKLKNTYDVGCIQIAFLCQLG